MHVNKNGKLVCECGRPRKYCSEECAHERILGRSRNNRRGNAEYNKKNTARMKAARQRQYEERIKPHYEKLKKLIANGDDEGAIKFLVDITNNREERKKRLIKPEEEEE